MELEAEAKAAADDGHADLAGRGGEADLAEEGSRCQGGTQQRALAEEVATGTHGGDIILAPRSLPAIRGMD
jgi:hypothetical protein